MNRRRMLRFAVGVSVGVAAPTLPLWAQNSTPWLRRVGVLAPSARAKEEITLKPFFDEMRVKGHRPQFALIVQIEQVFYHCAKAFLRSKLWRPETWEPAAMAPRPVIAQTLERPAESLESLEQYYGPAYAEQLYRA